MKKFILAVALLLTTFTIDAQQLIDGLLASYNPKYKDTVRVNFGNNKFMILKRVPPLNDEVLWLTQKKWVKIPVKNTFNLRDTTSKCTYTISTIEWVSNDDLRIYGTFCSATTSRMFEKFALVNGKWIQDEHFWITDVNAPK